LAVKNDGGHSGERPRENSRDTSSARAPAPALRGSSAPDQHNPQNEENAPEKAEKTGGKWREKGQQDLTKGINRRRTGVFAGWAASSFGPRTRRPWPRPTSGRKRRVPASPGLAPARSSAADPCSAVPPRRSTAPGSSRRG